jgi:class 3 adenylate cyclase
MDRPETRFAWHGNDVLAYQVVGDGPTDLLYRQGWISNVELNWDHPVMARFLRSLARSRRLIVTDPRGTGCSERSSPHDPWPLETSVDDTAVVMDAVGSDRAVILATSEQAMVACMFAATYPDRAAGLVLYQATANFVWSEETPWEWTEEQFEEQHQRMREPWTRSVAEADVRSLTSSLAEDPSYIDWWYRYNLLSETAGAGIAASRRYMDTDIRGILPSVHVPTLVLIRPGTSRTDWVESGRYLAAQIAGSRLVEIPGRDDTLWVGEQDALMATIDTFVMDIQRERSDLERVLATVLFADLVASTEIEARLGDRAWGRLVERHHADVRALLARFRGTEVDTAGDSFFATFDGPARAIRCAQAVIEASRPLGLTVRAGLHTGEVETIDGKAGGLAVTIGARVAAAADASEVLVSQTVKDLVAGSGLIFEDAGEHELKGVPDRWRLYRVVGP